MWGQWIAARLELLTGPLVGTAIEVHASAPYVHAITAPLDAKGARLLTPLAGLGLGERLSWYAAQAGPAAALADLSAAVTPATFLETGGTGLKGAGLYSWWVDEAGAADLSRSLGLPLAAGLIYAGCAGATRWPSGKPSTNTLWSRIRGMHLGGRHEFSTFRRTLGSVLAEANRWQAIDEQALTDWMMRHLRVVAVPHKDPDVLGKVEAAVLAELDPPLNLQSMATTPVRTRISELRKTYGHI